ncbi:hypothetical protein [Bacillus sp. V59.32b]|uniref:hypothetical protein n=1 Tax=Bacillus sp. V59.32b TaxID=1758642 RepID=UPI001C1F383F|nr:hypothetical protein [Bacillus sp. V59.32b]
MIYKNDMILERTQRFETVFSDIASIHLRLVTKKSRFGRPVELNDATMIYSLVARISERIPFMKDVGKRLKNDRIFCLDCGFFVSDSVPSEAAYSRMITIISESNVWKKFKRHFFIKVHFNIVTFVYKASK